MTHEDEGHYRLKHPAGSSPDPAVVAALADKADQGRVTCEDAHATAAELGLSPAEVGKTADLLEYRIVRCQLGLFGYAPEKSVVRPLDQVPAALHDRLRQGGVDGMVGCLTCWEIAQELGLEKMTVSAACETLGMKISQCQLGAF